MNRLQKLMIKAMKEHLAGGERQLPDGSVILWNAFIALSRSRTYGPTGPNPIGFSEIEAWSRLMRVPLEPHHVQIILEMDRVWMKHAHRDSSAPEGVKALPRSSEHKLTPAMFDLALR
jgi:hypothetical protein